MISPRTLRHAQDIYLQLKNRFSCLKRPADAAAVLAAIGATCDVTLHLTEPYLPPGKTHWDIAYETICSWIEGAAELRRIYEGRDHDLLATYGFARAYFTLISTYEETAR